MSDDKLTLRRPRGDTLSLSHAEGRFTLATTGGGNITPGELAQIEAFASGKDGADDFLAKVRARAAR